ncbi:MAG: hypothetical protein OHK0023_04740 [Anaerolineae bacterium]
MNDQSASAYGNLFELPAWREMLREASRHLPPSGATLRLLDLSLGDSALSLLTLRPDLHATWLSPLPADVQAALADQLPPDLLNRLEVHTWSSLPFPIGESSTDALMASIYWQNLSPKAHVLFWAECQRVLRGGGRMILIAPAADADLTDADPLLRHWHASTRRYQLSDLVALLERAGFERVLTERTLNGAGILARGEKPYTQFSTTERVRQTAQRDDSAELAHLRGKFVFLLIRQTPNKPIAELSEDEPVIWEAAMLGDSAESARLLLFSSLPKAVQFMQAAILDNALSGINKIGKFPREIVQRWSLPLLINPEYAALKSANSGLGKVWQSVNPQDAIWGEE